MKEKKEIPLVENPEWQLLAIVGGIGFIILLGIFIWSIIVTCIKYIL